MLWYQWYLNTERGRAGFTENRRGLCRLLWRLWSPNWRFDDTTFEATAASFDNPDFVDVTVQSYRHRYRNAPGDPTLEAIETALESQPAISVPTIVLHGAEDGVAPPRDSGKVAAHFTQLIEQSIIPVAGHFLARETPEPVIAAVRKLLT